MVSVANALVKQGREMHALVPPRGSMAGAIQAALPGALVAAAGHHLPASELEDLDQALGADVLVCSDHPDATAAAMALIASIEGLRPLDAGSLAQAAAIEAFTAVLVTAEHPLQGPQLVGAHRPGARLTPMMRLYDTTRGEIVAFEPGPVVSMYSCGITPYDAAHVGHAQVYLTFDILQRRLIDLGHEPRLVRNVTDVDDDILRKARELGVHYLDLAAEEMARFDANMAALGLLPVYSEPRATSAIPDILSLIGAVLDAGHAYSAGGVGVLRRVVVPRASAR